MVNTTSGLLTKLASAHGEPTHLALRGNVLVSASDDNDVVCIWDLTTATCVLEIPDHVLGVFTLDVHWAERLVCVGCRSGLVQVTQFDLETQITKVVFKTASLEGEVVRACLDIAQCVGQSRDWPTQWPPRRRVVMARLGRLYTSDLDRPSRKCPTQWGTTDLPVARFPPEGGIRQMVVANQHLIVASPQRIYAIDLRLLRPDNVAPCMDMACFSPTFIVERPSLSANAFGLAVGFGTEIQLFSFIGSPSRRRFEKVPEFEIDPVKQPRQTPPLPLPTTGPKIVTYSAQNMSWNELKWREGLQIGDALDAQDTEGL